MKLCGSAGTTSSTPPMPETPLTSAAVDSVVQAYVVTSQPPRLAGKEPVIKRWAVLCESAEVAVELVRERVASECTVEATDEILAPEKVDEIGLKPHHATGL